MMISFYKKLLAVGAAAIGFGGLLCADAWAGQTYTWLASPVDANWDLSTLNWTVDGADTAWVNNAEDPNDVIFGDSSSKTISVGGTRRIHDLTINKGGYSFQGSSCNMVIYGTMTVDGETHFKGKVSSGAADGALRLTSTKTPVVYFDTGSSKTNDFTCIYIDGTPKFAPNNDNAFGVYPTTPTENIFIVGTPTIFGGAQFSIKANRIIKIASGKNFKTGSNNTFTYKCPIIAENTAGATYSKDTYVQIVSDWSGLVVFDPGANVTNAPGKLKVQGRAKLASGVTHVTTGAAGGGSNASLYVSGSGAYSSTKGNLLVDGGELYSSTGGNADVSTYGQVTVTNFGKIYMPKVDWMQGNSGCAKLTVAKDGEFLVNLLRISQSSSLSEIHLNEGGLISATLLCTDGNTPRNGKFRFNGGRLRSRDSRSPFVATSGGAALTEAQAAGLTFAVGEKGAVFDTELKNLFWNRPLVSDPEGTDTDGGLHKIGGNILILTSTNFYNGVTWIEGGDAQLRVDNALPPGTTLRLSNGGFVTAYTFEKESPQRSTEQWIGRVEGDGTLKFMTQSHVTNSIAPSVDGKIKFESRCDLSGDYEVVGNANGCSCLQVVSGQSISNLTLKVADFSTFDRKAAKDAYQILSAPDGYTGKFALPEDWSKEWLVKYAATGVYVKPNNGLVISVR